MAVIGIAGVVLVSFFTAPDRVSPGAIDEGLLGRVVSSQGTISSFATNNGNIFIQLSDDRGRISVVMFERTAQGTDVYSLKEGDNITATGKVLVYKGDLEIQADSIKKSE